MDRGDCDVLAILCHGSCPFVPYFLLVGLSPKVQGDMSALGHLDGVADGEEDGEPTKHARGVCVGMNRDRHVLVQYGFKVAGNAMHGHGLFDGGEFDLTVSDVVKVVDGIMIVRDGVSVIGMGKGPEGL